MTIADFSHLPTHCKFVALMPQWDFLDFLAAQARALSARSDLRDAGRSRPVSSRTAAASPASRRETPDGPLEIRADLVVGADGRRSIVRERAGLTVDDFGAPIDVLWMRCRGAPDDPAQAARLHRGRAHLRDARSRRLLAVRLRDPERRLRRRSKRAGSTRSARTSRRSCRSCAIASASCGDWDDVKLLTVLVDRLRRWHRPGLLCIGDAAHAMSPIGGVGINLAIQDAVAAANILSGPLARGACRDSDLARVQKRREFPTRVVQRVQVIAQDLFLKRTLEGRVPRKMPVALKLLQRFPMLRRIPARLVGMGIRPEHIAQRCAAL